MIVLSNRVARAARVGESCRRNKARTREGLSGEGDRPLSLQPIMEVGFVVRAAGDCATRMKREIRM